MNLFFCPQFKYVENALNNGKEIFFPTEFLHGLNDGGHGAALDDQWKFMMSKPLSAGAFLWVFADEGVVRHDLNDSIDTDGNRAPDGILGPFHEKEGSFYTVKEIWSPVRMKDFKITSEFTGKIPVTNTYLYTNLNLCKFSFELVRFGNSLGDNVVRKPGIIAAPDIAPGHDGFLVPDLPSDWKSYDAFYITAIDQYGRLINTWSWNITSPQEFSARIVRPGDKKVQATENADFMKVSSGTSEFMFDRKNGSLVGVRNNGQNISFLAGNMFTGIKRNITAIKSYYDRNDYVIEAQYDSASYVTWRVKDDGWLQLDFGYGLNGSYEYAGVTFSYPEKYVTGARLIADGPYHVWKNRLKGTQFGIYDKKYNDAVTGQRWEYPEFKGYYANLYATEIQTTEQPITIVSPTQGLFLHLFTPAKAGNLKGVRGEVSPNFPSGNISLLHGITAIGTKFSRADQEGPQGQKNRFNGTYRGTVYFRFGK
ncbi:MAG TPA: hypothetical protein VHO68_15050 [Bacteroidales bacterium]|nr:hypothetical protein [Bacteroidales bacterium]